MKQRFNNTPFRRHGIGPLSNQPCTHKLKVGMDRLIQAIFGNRSGIVLLPHKENGNPHR